MSLAFGTQRPLISQTFLTFSFAATAVPTPISTTVSKQQLITTFIISNPLAGGSVYLGNQGVTTTTGLEIQPGTSPVFTVLQEGRQVYEIQGILADIAAGMQCRNVDLEKIPFVVWDLSQIFIIGGTTVSVGLFPTMYL